MAVTISTFASTTANSSALAVDVNVASTNDIVLIFGAQSSGGGYNVRSHFRVNSSAPFALGSSDHESTNFTTGTVQHHAALAWMRPESTGTLSVQITNIATPTHRSLVAAVLSGINSSVYFRLSTRSVSSGSTSAGIQSVESFTNDLSLGFSLWSSNTALTTLAGTVEHINSLTTNSVHRFLFGSHDGASTVSVAWGSGGAAAAGTIGFVLTAISTANNSSISMTTNAFTTNDGAGASTISVSVNVENTTQLIVWAGAQVDSTASTATINTSALSTAINIRGNRAGLSVGYVFPDTTGSQTIHLQGSNWRGMWAGVFSGVNTTEITSTEVAMSTALQNSSIPHSTFNSATSEFPLSFFSGHGSTIHPTLGTFPIVNAGSSSPRLMVGARGGASTIKMSWSSNTTSFGWAGAGISLIPTSVAAAGGSTQFRVFSLGYDRSYAGRLPMPMFMEQNGVMQPA